MAQVRLSVDEADGRLPAVCMCCGEPATTTVTRKMQWHPGWLYLILVPGVFLGLIGLLLYAVIANAMSRRAVVQAPLCDAHKGHWFKRAALMWGSFFLFGLVGVGAVIAAANLDDPRLRDTLMPFAGGLCFLGLVGWIAIVIVCKVTEIGPKEITDSEVLLGRVSDGFVEAVAEADREREERRARRRRERERPGRWREEADDEEELPRRPRASSDDRIEE